VRIWQSFEKVLIFCRLAWDRRLLFYVIFCNVQDYRGTPLKAIYYGLLAFWPYLCTRLHPLISQDSFDQSMNGLNWPTPLEWGQTELEAFELRSEKFNSFDLLFIQNLQKICLYLLPLISPI
jgi:hypothetical protein